MPARALTIPVNTKLFLVFFSVVLLGVSAFAQPSVTLSRKVGPPTTELQVTGSNFPTSVLIDIYFGLSEVAQVVANPNNKGYFFVKIQVPASAPPGTNWVTAVVSGTGEAAQAPFNVQTNWPEFQFAPNLDGANPYENVLSPSNAANLGLLWTFTTGSWVDSSPAVVDGVVYIGSGDGNVYALNARTGKKLWQYTTGGSVESSPAVVEGVVYVGSDDNNLYALDASTGAYLWQISTGGAVESSPAVANGVVYVGSADHNVYAVTKATATSPACIASGFTADQCDLWQFATGSYIYFSPSVADGVVYAGSDDGNLYALNAVTGMDLWQFTAGPGNTMINPTVVNGAVYSCSGNSFLYALNASTGAQLWNYSLLDDFTSPAVANGVIYLAGGYNGNVYALNASTGAVLWQYTTGAYVNSSPAVANGVVYVGSNDGTVYAFSLPTPPQVPERPDPAALRPDTSLRK